MRVSWHGNTSTDIALWLVPAAGVAYRSYRVARVIKAATVAKPQAAYRSTKTVQPTFRASRHITKAAGKKWEKSGSAFRGPKYKNSQKKVTSNFPRYEKGDHRHTNFNVTHRGRR